MADIPQDMFDAFIAAGVNLNRVEAGLRREIISMLVDVETEIVNRLITSPDMTGWQSTRLKQLARDVRAIVEKSGAKIGDVLEQRLEELAIAQARVAVSVVNAAIGVDVSRIGVNQEQLKALVSDVLIQGAPSSEWWSNQETQLVQRFMQQVRMGVVMGETNNDIARRIRGTKQAGYRDGIMEVTRQHAQTLVRTSVITVANAAKTLTFQQNPDLFKGIQWVATLDSKTTPICRALDGKIWDLDLNPIGHGFAFPGPTAHWNCRSTQVPVLKSFSDLAGPNANQEFVKRLENMPESTRSSLNGQVSESMDYEQWLKTQPSSMQLEVLGPTKLKLWKAGKITMSDMIDQTGRPLTVKELVAKYDK